MNDEADRVAGMAGQIVGIDLDHASLIQHQRVHHALLADGGRLPFASGSFDLVTANMVVEHLSDPAGVLREVRRVLRPGGRFIYHTPNLRNFKLRIVSVLPQPAKNWLAMFLEGRAEEDVYPTHYRMNTPGAARRHAAESGFDLEDLVLVEDSASAQMLGPVVVIELLVTKLLRAARFTELRSNLVVALRKPV
jgi:ubiquinone/menaquinone biosynthesis C-methylase UbiE